MSADELNVVYTCGLCEEICKQYFGHPCLEGYSNVCLDNNHYFFPVLDDGKTIIRKSLMEDGTSEIVREATSENGENARFKATQQQVNKRRKIGTQLNKLSDNQKERLIIEVQKRIPLWNINIPLEKRSKEIKDKLWEEVAAALDGRINAQEAKIKFKALRDTYRKIVHHENRASGSSRVETDGWKFYKCCEFLRDSCLVRLTSSNVSEEIQEQDERDELVSSLDETSSKTSRSTVKKGNNVTESNIALNRIANAIEKDYIPLTLPEAPKLDSIGAYLTAMGEEIRLLPKLVQIKIIKKFNDIVYEESFKHVSEN